jgi:glutaredoxin
LSDFWPHGKVARRYGVLRDDGKSERAIFIIDGEGIIRYIDIHDIDQQPSNEVLFEELRKITPGAAAKQQIIADEEGEILPEGDIIMYCNTWCPDCRKARSWFAEQEIGYQEINVARSRKGADQVREWANGNLVTPTINIRGTVVVGWDVKHMEELLLDV